MDLYPLFSALLLGIVEGFTQFLPISSTGHLILAGDLLGFNDDRGKLFEIVIQSGAILAVVWEYRRRFADVLHGLPHDPIARRFVSNLAIAFMPLAVLGLLFGKLIKATLFAPVPVAIAFIVGAFIILWAEKREHTITIHTVDDIGPWDALKLGLAQACALIPGTSRSGSTIIGGLFFGLSRKAATEFSFFLAIPTMFAATLYDLYKHGDLLSIGDLGPFAVGFLAAFASAFVAVRALLRYIQHHDFTLFAWYRIGFGLLILVLA
jgi:undecaprenyl-diphosphatase